MRSTIRQSLLRSLAAIAAALLGALLYGWFAPYSSEMGVVLVEVPLLLLFLLVVTLVTLAAAWAATRHIAFPSRFWMAVLTGIWAGVALAEYFYPPQARRLSPPPRIETAAEGLCKRFVRDSPWLAQRSPSPERSCESRVMSAPKGMFGWKPPDSWSASLTFRYRDGVRALLVLRLEEARYRFDRLILTYPRTAPPIWSGQNLATWQPARWPWQWAMDDSGGKPPAIRRQRECDVTPGCPPDAPDAYWRFDVVWADGRALAWIARIPAAGSPEESLLFLRAEWSLD